jgi:hypothetical protein
MLRAVFVRTLKPGVSYQEFLAAWAPVDADAGYPATVSVSRNVSDDRQVITVLGLSVPPREFASVAGGLTRPDALERLSQIVESTQLEGVYEQVLDTVDLDPRQGRPA